MNWFRVSYGDDEFCLIIKATNKEEAIDRFLVNRVVVLKPAWPAVKEELLRDEINVEQGGDPNDPNTSPTFAVLE